MTCQRCHAENPEGSRFCHACGAPLSVSTAGAAAAAAPTPAAGQPPLRQHVSHTGKAAIIGFALVAVLGVFIMATAALSFMRPAIHPGATGGGIKPPAIQPGPPPSGAGPLAPLPPGPVAPAPAPAPSAPGLTPATPYAPVTPSAPAGPVSPEPTGATPTAPGPITSAPAPTTPPPTASAPGATPPKPAAPAAHPTAPPAGAPPVVRPAAPAAPAPRRPKMPRAAGPALQLQRYRAPSGLYTIGYPQGWHVREDPGQNTVVFFKDDPDEGTSFGMAMQPLPGAVSARQILAQFMASFQRQYPDATATVLTNSRAEGADTLSADAAWTGAARQAMRARLVIRVWTPPGSIRSWFLLMGGQAPEMAFPSILPTFGRMASSLTF